VADFRKRARILGSEGLINELVSHQASPQPCCTGQAPRHWLLVDPSYDGQTGLSDCNPTWSLQTIDNTRQWVPQSRQLTG